MHTTYHRGQLNTKIRELGGEPPLTDFIYWVGLDKPKADFTEYLRSDFSSTVVGYCTLY